jgi:D-xylose transport system substrate-binding protein
MDAVPNHVIFSDGPRGEDMHSVLLAPVPITRDNLNVVIDAGWVTREVVCQGVPAGTTPVCG